MTARVGIRVLQQHASEAVARAAAGETLEITDRGRPVAQLVPLRTSGIERLLAAGLLRASRRPLRDLPGPLARTPGRGLTDLLAEQRVDER